MADTRANSNSMHWPPAAGHHQRIYPVDAEAPSPPPTVPLVPRDFSMSDKGDDYQLPAPKRRRRRRSWCRCICCTLLALVVVVAASVGILYLAFDPKLPNYTVDHLRVAAFAVVANLTAHATFHVTVTATNQNKAIGIYYERGSSLGLLYSGQSLCRGALPAFYQGHRNTTRLTVALSGAARMGSSLMSQLQQQQQTGAVPMEFQGDVPVRVKLGALKLTKFTSRVRCNLVVNSLNANTQIKIKSNSCKFSLHL